MSARGLRLGVLAAAVGVSWSCAVPQISLDALSRGVPSPDLGDAPDIVALVKEMETKCTELQHQEVPFEEEITLGGAVAVNWAARGGGVFLDAVSARPGKADRAAPKNAMAVYVATVGKNLAAQSSRPGLRWTFGVLDSPVVNAFSAPGGYVMVTRGLLEKIDNEAQLAGVLAHEIAHINEKHALKAYREIRTHECKGAVLAARAQGTLKNVDNFASQVLNTDVRIADAAVIGKLTDLLVKVLVGNGFEQQQEHGADAAAAELMARAGYNPFEYIAFLEKIPDGPQNYSKHPSRQERQKNLRSVVAALAQDDLIESNGKPFTEYAVLPNTDRLQAAKVTQAQR